MRASESRPLTGRQQVAMAMKLSIASALTATNAALTTSTVQVPPSTRLSPKRARAAVATATRNSVAGDAAGGRGMRRVGDDSARAVGGKSADSAAGVAPAPEDATPLAPPQMVLTASRGADVLVAAAGGASGEEAGAATEAAQSSSSPAPEEGHDVLNMVIGAMAVGGGTSGSVERTVTVLRRPTGAWFYKRPNGKRSFIRTEHRVRVELAEGITNEMLRHTSPTNALSSKALKRAPSPRSGSGEKRGRFSSSGRGRGRGSKARGGGGGQSAAATGDRLIGTIVISPTGTNATGTVELRNVYERPVSGSWYYRRSGGGKGSLSKSQRRRVELIDAADERGRETGNSNDPSAGGGGGSSSSSPRQQQSYSSSSSARGDGHGVGGGRSGGSSPSAKRARGEDEEGAGAGGDAHMVGYIEISLNRGNLTEWKEVFVRPSGAYYYHRSSGTKGFVTAAMRERVVREAPPGARVSSPRHGQRHGGRSASSPHQRDDAAYAQGGGSRPNGDHSSSGSSPWGEGERASLHPQPENPTDDPRVGRIELNRGSSQERRWTHVFIRPSGGWYYLRSSGKRSFLRPEQRSRVVIEDAEAARASGHVVAEAEERSMVFDSDGHDEHEHRLFGRSDRKRSASAGGYADGFDRQMAKRARRAERSDSNSSESDYLSMQKAQWQRWKQRQMAHRGEAAGASGLGGLRFPAGIGRASLAGWGLIPHAAPGAARRPMSAPAALRGRAGFARHTAALVPAGVASHPAGFRPMPGAVSAPLPPAAASSKASKFAAAAAATAERSHEHSAQATGVAQQQRARSAPPENALLLLARLSTVLSLTAPYS